MVLRPERGIQVLMTTDAVGGVWSYCLSLAGARQRVLVQHTCAQRAEQVEQ